VKIDNHIQFRRLSETDSGEKLPQDTVSLYPGFPCAFRAVSTFAPKIDNSYALMCGPKICLYNTKMHDDIKRLNNYPFHNRLLHLVLEQDDIVMGISEKIREAIIDICGSRDMKILFVVTTCLCEIIGEDLDGLIEEVQKEVEPTLLLIHTDNFNTEDCAPGIERTMLVLEKLMEPQPVRGKTVNFLGAMEMVPDNTELLKLLTSKGIEILNVLPTGGSPEKIALAPAAELNIVSTHYGLPLAQKMKERFGTEYVYIEKALTPECIEQYYMDIADRLRLDIAGEVRQMRAEAERLITQRKNKYEGKTCALSLLYGVQVARYFDIIDFLTGLGFDVKVVFLSEILPSDGRDIERLLDKGIDPYIVRIGNYALIEAALKQLRPDYFFGGFEDLKTIVRLGIETRGFGLCNNCCGFEMIACFLDVLQSTPPGMEALKYRESMLKEV
jgi:nitrogenase molybdenum-cofactor synthesis protein NifE